MKKFISLIALCFFLKLSFSAVTVLPTSLAGANDTARCQHAYSVTFTATGSTAPYHFTLTAGSLPQGLGLDTVTGRLGGIIGYTTSTSVTFTIKARSTITGQSNTRAYTVYIRNTTLTTAQLVTIWSSSQYVPSKANVYDTWYNAVTVAQTASTNAWNKTGNTLSSYSGTKLGSLDSTSFAIVAKNTTVATILPTGRIGIGTTTPTAKLHINGASTLRYVDGNQGVNKVLTSDLNGVASWGNVPVSDVVYANGGNSFGARAVIGTTDNFDMDFIANNFVKATLLVGGNFGVGTATPSTKIQAFTGASQYGFSHTDNTVTISSYIGGGRGWFGTNSNHNLILYTNSNNDGNISMFPNSTTRINGGTMGDLTATQATLDVAPSAGTKTYSFWVWKEGNASPAFNINATSGNALFGGNINGASIPHDSTGLTTGDFYINGTGQVSYKY